MNIKMIFRSKALNCHSIERVFGLVSENMVKKNIVEDIYVPNPGFSIANYLNLKRIVKSQSDDSIYHITGDIHYAVFALPRKRCILTIHDCVFLQRGKGIKKWLLKKIFLDWPVSYATFITTISEKTKNEIVSLTGCNPQKITVIQNPVSPEIILSHKPFNRERPVILFIGSTPNKNLDRVIEALKDVNCTLNIVGNPSKNQRDKINEYKIDAIIERNISDQEMAQRYDVSDIVLFPSLYEGFGLPIIEGFKAGKPVVTSSISPMKELAGEAAWLVDPHKVESIRSSILAIINNENIRIQKIQAGVNIAEKYSPRNIAMEYSSLYNRVFENVRNYRYTIL